MLTQVPNNMMLPAGTAGQVLTSGGAGVDPSYQDIMPSGAIIYSCLPSGIAPTGYLKANGAAVSRTVYARLFAAIGVSYGAGDGSTTFNVPDLRGEFIRGWDDSRGIDSGRAFASGQTSDNLSHTHSGTTNATGSHTHTYTNPGSSTATAQVSGPILYGAFTTNTSAAGDHSHTLTVNANGGTESRPRNVALLACIKY